MPHEALQASQVWMDADILGFEQMNLGGAKDRPSLKEVWENAEADMAGKRPVHEIIPLLSFVQGIGRRFLVNLW